MALGIRVVEMEAAQIEILQECVESNPGTEIHLDIGAQKIRYNQQEIPVNIPESHRKALVVGIWDTAALLKSNPEEV